MDQIQEFLGTRQPDEIAWAAAFLAVSAVVLAVFLVGWIRGLFKGDDE